MIFFGWGHQTTKDYGAALIVNCSTCNNSSWWHLQHNRVWFTLFFIPVIPYESKYWLICETCSSGIELTSNQIEIAKSLVDACQKYNEGQITENVYVSKINELDIFT